MAPIVGIDLGTTNSLVAYLSDDGPRIIRNVHGDLLTPSVVGLDDDGTLLVGAAARELATVKPARCASIFKRYMGSDWKVRIGNHDFTAEELSSLVLRSLKRDAEAHFGEPVTRAVITVPAYFNNRQREATIRAGEIAELKVERIVNEPTAAALAYGFHEADEEKTLLVFDLGGGTFDVSLVDLFDGTIEVRASSGECFLGGEDFTRTLAARILARSLASGTVEEDRAGALYERAEMKYPSLVARLLRQAELCKRALTSSTVTEVLVPNERGELPADARKVTIARADYERWIQPYLGRLELPLRRVLADAQLKPANVDEVILVGGATRTPSVGGLVQRFFGRPPHCRLNPDEVVALGAAVQAGLINRAAAVNDLVVTDVAPFTLGVETMREFGDVRRNGYFLPVIFRNTTIPISRVKRVFTVSSNQDVVNVKIYQGEARRVEDNFYLGEFSVKNIPRAPAGQESIDIRFTYDLNGVLEVEATVVSTGRKVAHVVTKHADGISSAEVARAIAAMQRLKNSPRELEVNRLLLRRGERVYAELAHLERELLSQLIDGFEEALELQEPGLIERHRAALAEFLDERSELDRGEDA